MAVLNKSKDNILPEVVYIGKGSMWGNEFVIDVHDTRDEGCELYAKDLKDKIRSGEVSIGQLASLSGKDLVGFCTPLRCHDETLARVAVWAKEQIDLRININYCFLLQRLERCKRCLVFLLLCLMFDAP